MDKMTIGAGDWIVVCDGRKALILENVGDAKFPNLHAKETYDHPDESTHEQGTSQPGRVFRSGLGSARGAVAVTDFHDESERAFLQKLAERLNAAVTKGETKSLAMVASPRALGMIRQAYSPAVRHALRHEIAKDIVKMPVYEIEKMLVRSAGP